jgi:hypothetical protein
LDHDEVRSWTRWYRHITLAMWTALWTLILAGTIAVEALRKSRRPRLPLSVSELQRRLWQLGLAVPRTARHLPTWSQWRRWHQTIAPNNYDKHREALMGPLAA